MATTSPQSKQGGLPKRDDITKIDVKEKQAEVPRKQFVVFQLADEDYGIDILQLSEIIRMVPITAIPGSPDFIRGVINLRGRITVVVDLEKKIHLTQRSETASTRIIISELDEKRIGLVVDSVSEVLWIPVPDIKPAPPALKKKVELSYMEGVAVVGDRLIIVLDLQKLLGSEDMKQVAEIHDEYA